METSTRETRAQIIAWLDQYRQALRSAKIANDELEIARDAVLSFPGGRLDGMPRSSSHSDKTALSVERLTEAEQLYDDALEHCRRTRIRVSRVISSVSNANQRELLQRRYLLGQSFAAIADCMHFDYRWIRRLHQRALAAAAKAIPEKEKTQ